MGVVVALAGVPWVVDRYPAAEAFGITFVSIVIEAMPFVILGSVAGGVIEVFVRPEWLTRRLPRNRVAAVMLAALGGVVLPVCECAIVPVTRRLLGKGMPLSVALAYLLAAPIVNPLVAASTAVAYLGDGTRMVLLRLVGGYIVAVTVSLLAGWWFGGRQPLLNQLGEANKHAHDHEPEQATPLVQRIRHVLAHATDDFILVGQYLVIGSLLAALVHTALNRSDMIALADYPLLSSLMMMGMAVGLNLCSEADAFVAASFRGLLPLSAQLAFLVLGPMVDLKLAAMYMTFMKRWAALTVLGAVAALVFVYVVLVELALNGGLL